MHLGKYFLFGLGFFLAGFSKAKPLETVPSVDLDQYVGVWYEIARLPFSKQEGCFGSTATYSLQDDGNIGVINRCFDKSFEGEERKVEGVARVVDSKTNSKLEVQFFWPFWGDYWIISLDEDYQYAVVGEPRRRYLWVLSRTPELESTIYDALLESAEGKGYDLSQITKTPQRLP